MGAIGGVLRATSGPPKYSTISSVKNPALQSSIDREIGGLGSLSSTLGTGLDRFSADWNAGTPAAAARTNEEIGSLSQFYNGSMANQLAALRANRAKAVTAAADVASQQAIAAQNRSRLSGDGGLSSYNTRQTMANLTPIRTQAALDDAAQARTDLGYLTDNQVRLAGQRQGLANSLAGRGLVPSQTRLQLLGGYNQYMAGLTNLDQANKFYGLQKAPNMWADIADSLDQGVLNGAAVASSVYPMAKGMKGGGYVNGPGTGTSDSVPARLSKGEYVVPADVVRIPGVLPLLEKMRHLHRMHHVGKHQEALKMHIKRTKESEKAHAKMREGGKVLGYADGGMVSGFSGFGAQRNVSAGGGGGGGGAGGLTGAAMQLGDRVNADLTPEWSGPTMIGNMGGMGGEDVVGGLSRPRVQAPSSLGMSGAPRQNLQGTPYFHPDNWNDVPDSWKVWGAMTAAKYNDPRSPHYIAPGTYE